MDGRREEKKVVSFENLMNLCVQFCLKLMVSNVSPSHFCLIMSSEVDYCPLSLCGPVAVVY